MENSESGDDVSHAYLAPNQSFVLAASDDCAYEQGENTDDSGHETYKNVPLREQDRFLPIANIAKIMKRAIPDKGKIAKDAREIIQECVSEFISFVTSEASDRCRFEKRKTINGEDILFAMTTLGFDNYVEPLKLYLSKYREISLNSARNDKQPGTMPPYSIDLKNAQVRIITDNGQTSEVSPTYSNNWNML